jgi:hypothetical protein
MHPPRKIKIRERAVNRPYRCLLLTGNAPQ